MSVADYWSFLGGHLAELVTVFMVLVILSSRRDAHATMGWLLLVIFLPYAGAILYVVFGRRHAEYPKREHHQALAASTRRGRLPARMELTRRITGLDPVSCNDLELLKSAEEKYVKLFADIGAARKRVVLCYYVFRRDRTGFRLLELLAKKAEEGVDVYLLYDGWGAFLLGMFGKLDGYTARGVKIGVFAPVSNPLKMGRVNFRNHRKIAVIDGEIGYTGSTNIGDEYLGLSSRYGPWRDLHLRLTGKAAVVLEGVFADDWKIATGEELVFEMVQVARGEVPIHVLPTGPDLEDDRLFPLLFAQIAKAKSSIEILTPYLVPNHALVSALSVAARQGVKVRLVLPKRSNHPMVAAAGRSYYEELLEGGVEIYQVPGAMLHAKALIIDKKWAMLGSANFDNRSFFLNFEINVALSNKEFVDEVVQCFDEWEGSGELVDVKWLALRSVPAKLFEAICRTLSPVL